MANYPPGGQVASLRTLLLDRLPCPVLPDEEMEVLVAGLRTSGRGGRASLGLG